MSIIWAMGKAAVLIADDGRIMVHFNYDRQLVDSLKAERFGAAWDPKKQCWWIPDDDFAFGKLLDCLDNCDYHAGFTDIEFRKPGSDLCWIESAIDSVDDETAPKLFKALATILHPDLGGDREMMIELNRVWSNRRGRME